MNNITKIAVSTLLGLAVLSTAATADVKKGQKIYLKKMKKSCGFSGAKFAHKHTQDEWENIKEAGKFSAEASKVCPGLKLKSKYENHVYDFAYEYASDSGNVPSC
jgi:hypothetical protein